MGEQRTPKTGDRVRVVLEGVVGPDAWDDKFVVGEFSNGANWIVPTAPHVKEVEILAPAVVTFKPGDRVRAKGRKGVRHLAYAGYFNEALLTFYRYKGEQGGDPYPAEYGREDFTSEKFEKVD